VSLRVGSVVTLSVEKPVAGGRMLARHEGQVVLVAGAIPGERVVARVERTSRGVAHALVTDMVEASPDRREPGDWRCGGNLLAFIAYPRQLSIKRQIVEDAFARVGRLTISAPIGIVPSPERGYRLRVRLHVERGRLGFYREGSRALCDPASTGQLLSAGVEWLTEVGSALARDGSIAAIGLEMAETIQGDTRAAHVLLAPGTDLRRAAALGCGAAGVSAQSGETGPAVLVTGTTTLVDRLEVRRGGASAMLDLRRNVRAFFQGNRYLVEELVAEVVGRVTDGPIVDLYAGVGLFGLALAALGADAVTLVEGDVVSRANLVENAVPFGRRAQAPSGSVETFLGAAAGGALARNATVIVDPPRTGLSREALDGVIRAEPGQVVYVSCDPPTLARDARQFVDAGYRLGNLTVFDLFPNTAHVETVATFTRGAPAAGDEPAG
jgi:23S rRNA (uracil1939-C5)-methyltransferase